MLMVKILNKLFGWDYIYWRNSADAGMARVFVSRDNRVFYLRYRSTTVIDLITDPKQVLWLTCPPEKYFPNFLERDEDEDA